ncbi:BamA/OMP85 family outer membrane protein [Aeoliella mucimassa]|uniref:BamA/OMP85 family outer membrane protein n=1 Tax=Aeoliella mucimassa TaxID=2527972 RepID=UPI001E3825B9|nr:POTRA domain-containing protein [Aeoliella mucimassa]
MVADIRIEGARSVPAPTVLKELKTRIGRPYDPLLVQADVKRLFTLPWFVNVETYTDQSNDGVVVIFKVVERPTVRYIEFLGNNSIKDKKLLKETGLNVGGALSPYQVEEARSRIEQLYKENGFNRVQVRVVEGDQSGDRAIVFDINEGPQQKVGAVKFEGNQFASDGRLKTKIQTKPGMLFGLFKGYIDPKSLESDQNRLTNYYRQFGFFQARVSPILEWSDDDSRVTIRWIINEGPQSSVRQVRILGNELFATTDLKAGLKLQDTNQYEQAKLTGDVEWLKELYGSRGYVFTDVKADVRYLDEPGQVDLVYTIDEGERYRVGRIFVHIGGENPHTRISTALNRLSIKPGEIMDIREIHASERRLQASSLFLADPSRNVFPSISFRIPEVEDEMLASDDPVYRGQNPAPEPADPVVPVQGKPGTYMVERPSIPGTPGSNMDVHLYFDGDSTEPEVTAVKPSVYTVHKTPVGSTASDSGIRNKAYSGLNFKTSSPYHQAPTVPSLQDTVIRGQSPDPITVGWASGSTPEPRSASELMPAGVGGQVVQATGPSAVPAGANQVNQVQYNEQGPFGPPPVPPTNVSPITPYPQDDLIVPGTNGLPTSLDPTVDVFLDLEETQTGRFMLGVGINSDAGVVGQILLDERNFDWRRPPRSWQDVVNGTAWRGGGQRLRIEAAPGSQVNRYLVNFQEPFLMGTPISLGLSGSYYDRRYEDWDEGRLGGKISLGYQWVQSDVSTVFTYRGESVNISNPSNSAEPQLAEVLGDNVLHGFKAAVVNDTRDSTFLATQGHRLEFYGEQVIGTYDYPRIGFDAKKYFLVHERADHSGRHVVSLTSQVDYSGSNTPLYDQYFAGGFSTMRGFDFRGASPVSNGVIVGGEFLWLNSVEYMFPITADDMFHGVVFCDFGTVEPKVEINDFRVSPGFGFRITVPAMGPAPIALDFAFPVAKADFDDTQVFSFSIGFLR